MKQWSKLISAVAILALSTVSSFGKVTDYRFEECSEKPEVIKNHAIEALNGVLSGDAIVTKNESTLTLKGQGNAMVAHDSKLDIIGDLTISLWVNPTIQARQALIARGGSGTGDKGASNGEYFLALWEDGTVKYKHNSTADTFSTIKLPQNSWSHIVVTRKEVTKEIKIYINGVLDTINNYSISPSSSQSKDLFIGSCPGCSSKMQALNGKLDELKLYNIVLTASETKAIFDNEKEGVHAQNHCYVSPAPIVSDDELEVFEGGAVSIDVLENDSDSNTSDTCVIDGATLQFATLTGATLSDENTVLTVPNQGIWRVLNNHVTFTPENDFLGSPTQVNYHVLDNCGSQSDMASISIIRTIVTDDNVPNRGTPPTIGTPEVVYGDSLFTIGDYVWNDANANGIQDEGEEGVEGIVVALYNSEGEVIERTTTNASGKYQFENVAEGTYSLGFSSLPNGYVFTTQYAGDDNSTDSDTNSVGRTDHFTLERNSLDFDAGIMNNTDDVIDDNTTTGISPDTDNENNNTAISDETQDCECEPYTDSIPSMGQIGVAVMLWLTTLLGLFFSREEKTLVQK